MIFLNGSSSALCLQLFTTGEKREIESRYDLSPASSVGEREAERERGKQRHRQRHMNIEWEFVCVRERKKETEKTEREREELK